MNEKKKRKILKAPWTKYYEKGKTNLEYPNCSLYTRISKTADKFPDRIATNYFDTTYTYKKLIQNIDICAASFNSLGIGIGDVVTICMPNTPEAITAFYALNKIGAIANMIHPLSGENEIKNYINKSNSKMLITIDLAWEKVLNVLDDINIKNIVIISVNDSMNPILKLGYDVTKGRKVKKPPRYSSFVMNWQTFFSKGKDCTFELDAKLKGNAYAAILYSGGTSGDPKGIVLSNRAFNAVAIQSIVAMGDVSEEDIILSILPIFHGFGLGICVHTILVKGATSILVPAFSAKTFDRLLSHYKPSIICGVPTLFEALLGNDKIAKLDLSFIRYVISGGDSLSISLKGKIDTFLKSRGSNAEVRQGYGLTECVAASCLELEHIHKPGSIGIPFPDVYYKIVEPRTHFEVPYGKDGEIVIHAPNLMSGYYNDEIETNKALQIHSDGLLWLHTGDMGYMDEDGFLFFKQRIKRMIVSAGYNLYPQYIENVIDSHPDVMMSTVVGIDHNYKGQVAKAFVVLKEGIKPSHSLKDSIKEYCAKTLPKYSLPYEIEFRVSLPKTLVGKIAYTKLMEEEMNKKNKKNQD